MLSYALAVINGAGIGGVSLRLLAGVGLLLLCAAQAWAGEAVNYSAVGLASWYGADFHGRRTSDGEVFDMRSISAANKELPLPCYARVTNLHNHKSIIVRVNDRGPYVAGRIVDLSKRTAELLGFQGAGTAKVRVEYVGKAPAKGGDENYLLSSLRLGDEDPAEGVSAFAPTHSGPKDFMAMLDTLTAARRAARSELRSTISEPPSPFGVLAPSPYGDLTGALKMVPNVVLARQ